MQTNQLNMMVVEDDDFQRQLVVGMLNSLGVATVLPTRNGREALDIIRGQDTKPVHIALCNLNMPEMDGMELLRHLGQENRNVAVMITSALDARVLSSVARMARMHGLKLLGTLEKPIMLEQLKTLISKYEQTENKWQGSRNCPVFSLDEIVQGIHADQFQPYFQPKVELKSGRLIGAEVLARWVHPVHGEISPAAFIPPLEQSKHIDALTWVMLEKSAKQCRALLEEGHLLSLSVNVSLVSLEDPQLAERLTQVVRDAGVDPQHIVLEITESAAVSDAALVLENLARLCMNGFALSIDDYGTGYSSIQQLTRIAFSELKIDQSFVKDLGQNETLSIVVESSIEMARKLKMKSTAEGIETQEDWNNLSRMGCDIGQGYFIARPMPAAKFPDFIHNYHAELAAVPSPETKAPLPVRDKLQVLLIDDDDFTRKFIHSMLKNLAFSRVTEASSAESALKLIEDNSNYDLIITDINMGTLNGLGFIQAIRSGRTSARRDSRIVVLTAYSHTEVLSSALALDVNGFLVKPLTPATADDKLIRALTEQFQPSSPLAYEAVKTEFKAPLGARQTASASTVNASVIKGSGKAAGMIGNLVLPLRLRPGMVLNENVFLSDGTLLLSAGHIFSELSINRLNELGDLLKEERVAVQEGGHSN